MQSSPADARRPVVDVVIPALNEQDSIGRVLGDLPTDLVREVVVVDNGSSDRTPELARAGGATVVDEHRRGYGAACLRGLRELGCRDPRPSIVAFMDADYSDHPEELIDLVEPIVDGRADFTVGSRTLGRREPGALLPQARFGNWLATRCIRWLFGVEMTDLGPFRAIRWSTLEELEMKDEGFGWTAEMQAKAARRRVSYIEIPVRYRRRVGVSKISGTLSGTVRAGWKILYTIFRVRLIGR